MTDPLISVIIVTHNSNAVLAPCRIALSRALANMPHEIIIVDNFSDEPPLSEDSDRIVRLPENVGFARAANLGAGSACGDVLLFLNPDTEVGITSVREALATLDEAQCEAIVGARTYLPSGADNPFCYVDFPTLDSVLRLTLGMARPRTLPYDELEIHPVDTVTGCFMVLRTMTWQRLGGFDDRFFLYAEDLDLCLRARAVGIDRLISSRAHVLHSGGFIPRLDLFKAYCFCEANSAFMRKHWSGSAAFVGHILLRLWLARRYLAVWLGRI
jgi:N-acetylglucosaminyl-diphospho-decaprenol L-rhamnosyltransferase